MKLRTILIGMASVLIAFSVLIGSAGLIQLKFAVNSLETVYKDRVVPLRDLKKIADLYAVNIVDATHKARDGVLTYHDALKGVEDAEKEIKATWDAFLTTVLIDDELKLIAEIKPLMQSSETGLKTLKEILRNADQAAITGFETSDLYPMIDPLSDKFSALVNVQLDEAGREYDHAANGALFALYLSIGLILVAIIAGGAICVFTLRQTNKQLGAEPSEVALLVSNFAGGALNQNLSHAASAHPGSVLAALGRMQESLRTVVDTIQHNARALLESSSALNDSTEDIASASQRQSDAASAMASAVEELTVSVQQVSQNADDARKRSIHAGELSESGSQQIQKIIEDNEQIVVTANESAAAIESLGLLSNEIKSIVNVIRDVADQTNLLALNAAIEAARAGEQGRGFAVVADEVRKLAERTSQSTEEITSIVERISSGTARAVKSIHLQVELVTDCARISQEAGTSMDAIRGGARKVVEAINDISSALRDQSAASTDIAQNIEQVAQMSDQNHAAVQGAASSTNALRRMATTLEQAVSKFKT